MNYSPIVIVAGEPNSIFLEIFFKILKKNKIINSYNFLYLNKFLKNENKKLKI